MWSLTLALVDGHRRERSASISCALAINSLDCALSSIVSAGSVDWRPEVERIERHGESGRLQFGQLGPVQTGYTSPVKQGCLEDSFRCQQAFLHQFPKIAQNKISPPMFAPCLCASVGNAHSPYGWHRGRINN